MGNQWERIGKAVSPVDQIIAPDPAGETAAHSESLLMVFAGTCEVHLLNRILKELSSLCYKL